MDAAKVKKRSITKTICTVDGCDRPINARGLCGMHYTRAQTQGLFGTPCTIDGCERHVVGGGLCGKHYSQQWRENNRDKLNEKMRCYLKKYRAEREDKDKRTARGERFRKNNLEKFANKERIRRGKKRSNGGKYSQQDWLKLLNRFRHVCAYCGIRKATTADHVIPLAKGGSNFIGNILPACVSCNSSKQDTLLFEWRTRYVNRKENRA